MPNLMIPLLDEVNYEVQTGYAKFKIVNSRNTNFWYEIGPDDIPLIELASVYPLYL